MNSESVTCQQPFLELFLSNVSWFHWKLPTHSNFGFVEHDWKKLYYLELVLNLQASNKYLSVQFPIFLIIFHLFMFRQSSSGFHFLNKILIKVRFETISWKLLFPSSNWPTKSTPILNSMKRMEIIFSRLWVKIAESSKRKLDQLAFGVMTNANSSPFKVE